MLFLFSFDFHGQYYIVRCSVSEMHATGFSDLPLVDDRLTSASVGTPRETVQTMIIHEDAVHLYPSLLFFNFVSYRVPTRVIFSGYITGCS